MKRILEVAEQSFKTSWTHKPLWVFGLFVVAAGGGGGSRSGGHRASEAASQLPDWVVPLLVIGPLLGLLALVMHLLSEGALIRAVKRSRDGNNVRVGQAMRAGLKTAPKVLGVKLLGGIAIVGTLAAVAVPIFLHIFDVLSMPAAILITLPILALAVPVLITLSLAMEIALRIAVLEDKGVFESWRGARAYLSGRLIDSLQLFVLSAVAQAGFVLAALMVVLRFAAVGVAVWALGASILVSAITAGVLAAPFLLTLIGALGTFRSSVWTHGFLNARAEEAA